MIAEAKPLRGIDREKLDAVIEPVARAHGAEVVDVEFKGDRQGWVLRVFVEKLGSAELRLSTEKAAVDLDVCSGISHDLSAALDVADLIPHAYNLEISSPGVERVLRSELDFVRFGGKKAKLKLTNAIGGQKVLIGTLGPLDSGAIAVDVRGQSHMIPLGDIEHAQLVFEFGPAPKPGKRRVSTR